MRNLRLYELVIMIVALVTIGSCKKFVSLEPPLDQMLSGDVYTTGESATSAVRGLYIQLLNNGIASGNASSVTFLSGRSADDFINYSNQDVSIEFSNNNISPTNSTLRQGLWQSSYQLIYHSNSILQNLDLSTEISESLKSELKGEALFIRAFCYFYLTNLFNDVPLILTTDYRKNAVAYASTRNQVYIQIVDDLTKAKLYLPTTYSSDNRIRANKWVVSALLARVYLFMGNWIKAEAESSSIIFETNLFTVQTSDLNSVFSKNSKETIFQLGSTNRNTNEAENFILTTAPGSSTSVILSDNLLNSFESGDLRYSKWIGTFTSGVNSWKYAFKYKLRSSDPVNEYSIVFRLAEQYLIRSEARIHLEKTSLGISDLNVLRNRARALPTSLIPNPLPLIPLTLSKSSALEAVQRERRVELFSEWGHRWLDLKRTNKADAVLSAIKGANWQSTDVFYPIPMNELLNNINLEQNLGYN